MARSFDISFDLRLNKRLSKQTWDWWFETPSRASWRHRIDGWQDANKTMCQPCRWATCILPQNLPVSTSGGFHYSIWHLDEKCDRWPFFVEHLPAVLNPHSDNNKFLHTVDLIGIFRWYFSNANSSKPTKLDRIYRTFQSVLLLGKALTALVYRSCKNTVTIRIATGPVGECNTFMAIVGDLLKC